MKIELEIAAEEAGPLLKEYAAGGRPSVRRVGEDGRTTTAGPSAVMKSWRVTEVTTAEMLIIAASLTEEDS